MELKEHQTAYQLDKNFEKDIKDCKKTAEFIEKILTMLVKGFTPEYYNSAYLSLQSILHMFYLINICFDAYKFFQ